MARKVKRAPASPREEPEQFAAAVTNTFSYTYATSNAAPTSGEANQRTSGSSIAFNVLDQSATDRTAALEALTLNSTITAEGVTWNIVGIGTLTGGVIAFAVSPTTLLPTPGVTSFKFFTPATANIPSFPEFTPLIPTSAFPPGGGVGSIGDPIGVPTFPPPTPPPIGTVPAGPEVGPAISPAPVPPSLAGVTQPQYKTGSATTPAANGYFPQFTTTGAYAGFPNNPPTGVPIVFANIWTKPTFSGLPWSTATWTAVPPPSTPTTAQIILDGWGLPGPSGSGPGPPSNPNPPGAGLPHASAVRDGYEEPAERSARSVLPGSHAAHVHKPKSSSHRGR